VICRKCERGKSIHDKIDSKLHHAEGRLL
jgi:hypothetical protein